MAILQVKLLYAYGKDLEVTAEEKDMGVTVTRDLRPTQQCRRAERTAR